MESSPVITPSILANHADHVEILQVWNQKFVSELTPFAIYMSVLTTLGLFGNSVVFLVYNRRFKTNPTRTYILALNICDLFINVTGLITEMTEMFFQYTFYWNWACKLMRVSMMALVLFSCFMLATVALERYKIVCRKNARMQRQNGNKVKMTVLLCCGTAVVLATPCAVVTGSDSVLIDGGVSCTHLRQYQATPLSNVYLGILAIAVSVTFVIMTICYERIALLLWRHTRNLRKTGRQGLDAGFQSIRHNGKVDTEATTSRRMSSANDVSASKSRHIENVDTKVTSSREMINANDVSGCSPRKRISERVTFMLSVLSFFFVLNYLPYGVHQFAVLLGAPSLLDTDRNLYMVTIRSDYVYSAVNAFVYISCSAKFRNECRRVFCKAMP